MCVLLLSCITTIARCGLLLETIRASVCATVGLLVTFVSPAKMIEPIEMPFGGLAQVGSSNHVYQGVQIPKGKG